MKCRHCGAELKTPLVDLGSAPPSNAYLTENSLHLPEPWFPLRVLVCEQCWLVQTEDFTQAQELFDDDYAYFSSFSKGWLSHCKKYVEEVAKRFGLTDQSHVVEVAANDGYLLQYVKALGIPCTGIEPTASTAQAAREKGVPIIEDFFGTQLAEELVSQGRQADLIIANNVLAHVPDINDFVAGVYLLLRDDGIVTFEFPHLMQLVEQNQFDTIYHEHFSYLSLIAVERVLSASGLVIFDVDKLTTHGGSLRIYAQRIESNRHSCSQRVGALLAEEKQAGMDKVSYYVNFQSRTDHVKNEFLSFLLEAKRSGKSVVGYGAAAKGTTLLNYGGVRPDLLAWVVDSNPAKQGKYLPGSRIPIVNESYIKEKQPDYIVVLPWNLRNEIIQQLDYARDWGCRFVIAVPELMVKA